MIKVVDFYENPFGECVYVSKDLEDAKAFIQEFEEDTDSECNLKIIQ